MKQKPIEVNPNNYCVIMAGGVGSRFWPLSRMNKPKQFLDILGVGKTLIQQTFDRFSNIVPRENIIVVTNELYKDTTIELLEIDEKQVLLEPMRKNTAPCIAYANFRILKENPNANIIVTPSDHLVTNEMEFLRIAQKGIDFIAKNDVLLTIGIKPSRPDTGYGYIQISNDATEIKLPSTSLKKVKTFTEKPELEMAKIFFESGEFFWNSGMFFWSLPSIMQAFDIHMSGLNTLFQNKIDLLGTEKELEAVRDIYAQSKSISIDYAIMEKADNVYVLCADFGWSDIGTWGSLYANQSKDKNRNAVVGNNVFLYDTKDCEINIHPHKLAVLQGLEDMIVVQTDDVLLVCKKEDEQRIKDFVNNVKMEKGDTYI
ncbi:MAG: mannose-1-phosphate guanylyltransferase [Bacteroidales bacterium]|jgi:mannose-1-phosphate guanylyltransferase|nr:mannose-1-phosphate guanylyltransferase [Bacteroidales bacterium]